MNDDVTLRDVMTREFVGVSESDPVAGAAGLVADEGATAAVVLRGSEPAGVLAARDVLALVASGDDPDETPVSEVMEPPVTLSTDASLVDAVAAMTDRDAEQVVVTDDGEVVGTIAARDVVATVTSLGRERPPVADPSHETERAGATDEFTAQSVCEVCGGLARGLANVNGQLVCSDCREF